MNTSLITKFIVGTLIILVINASSVSAKVETDQTNRPLTQDYFDYYQTTLLKGRDYKVSVSADIPVDFFIISSTDGKIFSKMVDGRDTDHKFSDLTVLYNSYNENITEINLIFNTLDNVDVYFVTDNSDVTGINANSSGVTSLKVEYTDNGSNSLPGFQFYLLISSFTLLVMIKRRN